MVTSKVWRGADINYQSENGETSLIVASAQGHEEIVKYLLKEGAKVNLRENISDGTALKHAKTKKIKELLKAAGAKE